MGKSPALSRPRILSRDVTIFRQGIGFVRKPERIFYFLPIKNDEIDL